eukprot:1139900-Pelagomonas_calceolata.AAC.1
MSVSSFPQLPRKAADSALLPCKAANGAFVIQCHINVYCSSSEALRDSSAKRQSLLTHAYLYGHLFAKLKSIASAVALQGSRQCRGTTISCGITPSQSLPANNAEGKPFQKDQPTRLSTEATKESKRVYA